MSDKRREESTEEISENKSRGSAKRPKDSSRGWYILIGVCCAVLALSIGVLAASKFIDSKWDKMQTLPSDQTFERSDIYVNPEIMTTAAEPSSDAASSAAETTEDINAGNFTTFMIYGVDARNNSDLVKDANADTDIICVINNDTFEVKLISIHRDTFLETTTGRHTKLTDIYAGYGVQESMSTINKCFDLAINQYVAVNWKMVAKGINLLGGIDIDLTSAEAEYINTLTPHITKVTGISTKTLENKGRDTYHLDGVQTVAHARDRTTGGGDDIRRANRQRNVLRALLSTAKSCSLSELNNAVDTLLPGISTNFTKAEVLDMLSNIKKYSITDATLFPFEYLDQSDLRTAYIYANTLTQNVSALHEFIYGTAGYEPSETVKRISDYILEYRRSNP